MQPGHAVPVNIDEAAADPEQAGAHSVSRIVFSRPDASDMLNGPEAVAAGGRGRQPLRRAEVPAGRCAGRELPRVDAGRQHQDPLGSGVSLFTVPGKLYLAEATQPGDVASIVATVPAKVGVPDRAGSTRSTSVRTW